MHLPIYRKVLTVLRFLFFLVNSNLFYWGFPGGSDDKNLSAMQEPHFPSLVWGDPLEKEMATHSSIRAWRIPWTVESMGPQKV